MFIGLFVPLISDNVPTTNLAVHSTWKTTQAITLVDDAYHIGVGRCSDLGGGRHFFLNNKNVISLRNNACMQYGLQYCNEVHYVNSG